MSFSSSSSFCSYTPVYELVMSFLDQADEVEGRAAAVMRLGAAEEFMQHYQTTRHARRLWLQ